MGYFRLPTSLPNQATEGEGARAIRYAYKASLVSSAYQFELTDAGLSWQMGRRSGVWPYADIASIRLSYRPVSMQSRRFRADLERAGGERIAILSTTWQTVALMTPQDQDYRAFMVELHRRMQAAGSKASLIGGIGTATYAMAVAMLVLLAIAMIGTSRPGACDVRVHRRVVSGRHGGLVCLDRRRLHQAQSAVQIFVRRASRDTAAVVGFAIKRHEM